MRRARGFTLMEILIAMALTTIVTASVLAIVRTQLSAFEMNDQVVRTQQSARAAMDFLESTVRRACGGVAAGPIGVNTTNTHKAVDCFRFVDSASVSATDFTTSGNTLPDAIEVVYASGTMTALTTPLPTLTSSPTISVSDVTGFSKGDLVLVSDYYTAYLMEVQSVATTATVRPKAGTITFTSSVTTQPKTGAPNLTVGSPVFKATTYSFFVAPSSPATSYAGMLMVDPAGVNSINHTDYGSSNGVQPAVEGVVDFQVAVGWDQGSDGTLVDNKSSTDDWVGNVAGETMAPSSPWNIATGNPQLRQVRMTLLLQTLNKYSGAATPFNGTLTAFENRAASSYPSSATNGPRYRSASMIVAPRAWNLNE